MVFLNYDTIRRKFYSKKRLEWISKKAHELQISEQNFSQQDIIALEQWEASNNTQTAEEAAAHLAEVLRVD